MEESIGRRDFLKGAVVGAAVAAPAVSATVALADAPAAQPEEETAAPAAASAPYEVIDCDLLVIGGGIGAMQVAYTAVEQGRHVVMLDKAPFRHSGGAGYNWDCMGCWVPEDDDWYLSTYMNTTNNTELHYQMMQEYPVQDDSLVYLQRGLSLTFRNDDGSLAYKYSIKGGDSIEGCMYRFMADDLFKSPLVQIVDQTMVTDLFINDGRCLGAIALHLPTGCMRVYRADATVCCTGPTSWIYGWKTVSAYTIQSPDNTGDVDMAAFRHGAAIGENECMGFDFSTTYPEGFSFGWGNCLVPDALEYPAFTDRNGVQIFSDENMEKYGYTPEDFITSRATFNRFLAQLKVNGEFEAMDDGSIACDLANYVPRDCMKENLKFFDKVGIDMQSGPVAVHEESYERGGTPVVDFNLMSEDIEGAFFIRGAGAGDGISGGSYTTPLFRNGWCVVQKMLDYIDAAPALEQIDWTPVEQECERLTAIRTREVTDGVRPHELRHAIQRVCGDAMGIVRTVESLDAAAAELARIREEDLPRMQVVMPGTVWNREWKEAIENYNLLDAAELAIQAARSREETRGEYFFVDFPEPDPAWEGKMLVARRQDDGTISWERRVLPQHEPFEQAEE